LTGLLQNHAHPAAAHQILISAQFQLIRRTEGATKKKFSNQPKTKQSFLKESHPAKKVRELPSFAR